MSYRIALNPKFDTAIPNYTDLTITSIEEINIEFLIWLQIQERQQIQL